MSDYTGLPTIPDEWKGTLTGFVRNILILNGYAQAIQQIVVTNNSNQEPDWLPNFINNIDLAKNHVDNWKNNIEPSITTEIPNIITKLGGNFKEVFNQISDILKNCEYNPDQEQRNIIQAELKYLESNTQELQITINNLYCQFKRFQEDVYNDFSNLETSKNNIKNTISSDTSNIDKLESDMDTQTNNIASDESAMVDAGIAGGLVVGVGVMCLGPIGMIFGGLVILASVAEFATVAGIYSSKISDAQMQLNQDLSEISDDQHQIASLTVLSNVIKKLVDTNTGIFTALSSVAVWCQGIGFEIDNFENNIEEANNDLTNNMWKDIGDELDSASTDWGEFSTYASYAMGSITKTTIRLTSTPEAIQAQSKC